MYEVVEVNGEAGIKLDSEIQMFNNSDIGKYCLICLTNERDCLIMPCRHNAICVDCGNSIEKCVCVCPYCGERDKCECALFDAATGG